MLEYTHMSMKEIDGLRAKVREVGGQIHVVKNTLMKLALKKAGIMTRNIWKRPACVRFCFSDPPAYGKSVGRCYPQL